MLDAIIHNPELEKYIVTFKEGDIIFLEGDDSQDLYVLISGQLDVLKGQKRISQITEKGAVFGEMSFLLGSRRTATVKALDSVKVIRIPKAEINHFLREFPEAGAGITKLLAERLDDASRILFGLKEFCDQLPDAVILTNREGKILTWNRAAERLYGREAREMRNQSVEGIYEDPREYQELIQEVESGYPVHEKVLKVKHPGTGLRWISTSTTILYDGQHNYQGVLSLGRDVTKHKNLERRYRRALRWFIPLLALVAVLVAAIFYGYPHFSKGQQSLGIRKQDFRDLMAKDYLLLSALLGKPFHEGDRAETVRIMKDFLAIQKSTRLICTGLLLLDEEKKVFSAVTFQDGGDATAAVGSSYSGLDFEGDGKSLHRVLTLYRTDEAHPMGRKGVEMAFEMSWEDRLIGWLVFRLDMDVLQKEYSLDEKDLRQFRFTKAKP